MERDDIFEVMVPAIREAERACWVVQTGAVGDKWPWTIVDEAAGTLSDQDGRIWSSFKDEPVVFPGASGLDFTGKIAGRKVMIRLLVDEEIVE